MISILNLFLNWSMIYMPGCDEERLVYLFFVHGCLWYVRIKLCIANELVSSFTLRLTTFNYA